MLLEEEVDSEEEEEAVENASFDIRGDLEHIFSKDGFKFTGSYYASQSHPKAPNPRVRVEGMGPINLPLTETSAKRLIKACKQAPFGKGERTIVDKSVRDTYELDASKVS